MEHFLKSQGFEVIPLYNENATRTNIISKMESYIAPRLTKNDRVLIFYAGHGHTKNLGGKDFGYIVPHDGGGDSATYVSMETLQSQATKMGNAKHQLFIMDACYSGLLGTRTGALDENRPDYLNEITRRTARQIITAGGKNQQVLDGGPDGHSFFTGYMLEGLEKGMADNNGDGYITFSELTSYVIPKATNPYQTPSYTMFPGHGLGEFVFQTAKGPVKSVQPTPVPTDPTFRSGNAPNFEIEFWQSIKSSQKAEEFQAYLDQFPQGKFARLAKIRKKTIERAREAAEPQAKPEPSLQAKLPTGYQSPRQLSREITGKDGASMVLVRAGEFTMGSNDRDDEQPVHKVSLDAFYIDKYELTTSRYAKFLSQTKRDDPQYWNDVTLASDGDRPVIGVTWHDADAYCRSVGKRLPTEAEWEKAARGTDGLIYPWGNERPTQNHANHGKPSWNGYTTLTMVGHHNAGASPYGIHDMAGNAWEWVADWYDENYYKNSPYKNIPSRNPKGPSDGTQRGLRGGSWVIDPEFLRSANRYRLTPDIRHYSIGFRCAQDAP